MQWVQDPSQSSVDNRNNARHEASRWGKLIKKKHTNTNIDNLLHNLM